MIFVDAVAVVGFVAIAVVILATLVFIAVLVIFVRVVACAAFNAVAVTDFAVVANVVKQRKCTFYFKDTCELFII